MKKTASNQQEVVGGTSTKTILIPIILVFTVLLALIIVIIALTNYNSNLLSTTMQNYSDYISDAGALQGGSSLLSETATTFVLVPVTDAGYLNVTPLVAYASELQLERRGDQVVDRFRDYDVSKEAFEYILAAAESSNRMLESQLHAIALMDSIYQLPDSPEILNIIPKVELTGREQDYTKSQKEAAAEVLVLGTEYSENKRAVSVNTAACVEILRAESAQKSSDIAKTLGYLRAAMWVTTLSISFMLLVTFFVLYKKLVSPLDRFVHMIATDSALNDKKGLYEVRLLAHAYNSLLRRRDVLETGLRSAAETDALTGLQNRYSFQRYMLGTGESGYSIAFFLFDVNYLKKTNDTQGHLAGDKLLCDAAECISLCFTSPNENNCFRYGGDEFAAIVKDCAPDDIERMVERFEREQHNRNISVAFGYAYAEDIGNTTLNKLFHDADKKMYAKKADMKKCENSFYK